MQFYEYETIEIERFVLIKIKIVIVIREDRETRQKTPVDLRSIHVSRIATFIVCVMIKDSATHVDL